MPGEAAPSSPVDRKPSAELAPVASDDLCVTRGEVAGAAIEVPTMLRPAGDPKFGDYQANCAMSLGKALKRPPPEVAKEIVARLDVADLCDPPEVAGPALS